MSWVLWARVLQVDNMGYCLLGCHPCASTLNDPNIHNFMKILILGGYHGNQVAKATNTDLPLDSLSRMHPFAVSPVFLPLLFSVN